MGMGSVSLMKIMNETSVCYQENTQRACIYSIDIQYSFPMPMYICHFTYPHNFFSDNASTAFPSLDSFASMTASRATAPVTTYPLSCGQFVSIIAFVMSRMES